MVSTPTVLFCVIMQLHRKTLCFALAVQLIRPALFYVIIALVVKLIDLPHLRRIWPYHYNGMTQTFIRSARKI